MTIEEMINGLKYLREIKEKKEPSTKLSNGDVYIHSDGQDYVPNLEYNARTGNIIITKGRKMQEG